MKSIIECVQVSIFFMHSSHCLTNTKSNLISDKKVEIDELCIFLAVANHLNLTKDNNKYTMSRPVRHHTHPLTVVLEMKIYAILDMVSCTSFEFFK